MFVAVDLARHLLDYFKSRGYSESKVRLHEDCSSIDIPGPLSLTFNLGSELSTASVVLESPYLDAEYLEFMSNGGVDLFYRSISQEARDDRIKFGGVLRAGRVLVYRGNYQYVCDLFSGESLKVFGALFNECVRPTLYYIRKRGDKV